MCRVVAFFLGTMLLAATPTGTLIAGGATSFVLVVGALIGFPSPLFPPQPVVLAVGWMGFWMWRLDRSFPTGQPVL